MKKINLYFLFILFMLFGACDNFNDPESPYLEKYVVSIVVVPSVLVSSVAVSIVIAIW